MQSTGRENEVLLDENLVETAHLSPFYLREHSKRVLRGALYNDSKFLADINVMDYSLVVGVDMVNNELVVGIVGASVHLSLVIYAEIYFCRLYPHVHVGQEAGKLGERKYLPRRRGQGRANNRHSQAVSPTFLQRDGAVFPTGEDMCNFLSQHDG